MKLRKILPLVLVAPLLASCGGIKVEEPKFESYSNKVEHAAFVDALNKAAESVNFFKVDTPLASSVLNYVGSSEETAKGSLNHNLESKELAYTETKFEYDATNHLAKDYWVVKSDNVLKEDDSSSMNAKDDYKGDSFFQNETIDEVNSIVFVDLLDETYRAYKPVVSDYAKELEDLVVEQMVDYLDLEPIAVLDYDTISDEEKAKYSFYQDDNLFTVVYESEEEEKVYDIDDATKEIGTKKMTDSLKLQVRLEASKIEKRSSSIASSKIEFTAAGKVNIMGDNYYTKEGNTYETGYKSFGEAKYEEKEVSLAKKDLSKYAKLV